MMILKITIFFTIIASCFSITIDTKLGKIKGSEKKSRDGRVYYSFTRIPFAKPPVGNLRLQNPQNIDRWVGTLDATMPAPPCLQVIIYLPPLRNTTFGSEDCLYLNIFTPKIDGGGKKLPVMFYIHGGGFRSGSPGPEQSPQYFMDEDIVLVSIQYRIGTLGFLSFEDDIIPGNFGMKDQAKALHWVKDNIDAFGGNPNEITAFGESAGGASTHLHMMSPRTRDLLKGGLSQSGNFNRYWSFAPVGTSQPLAIKIASKLNCHNRAKILQCLQSVNAEDLIRSELELLYWDSHPLVALRIVRERPSEGAFLDFNPFTTVTDLPWVTGISKDEGTYLRAVLMTQDPSVTQQFIDNMDDYIARMLSLDNLQPTKVDLSLSVRLLKEKYFRQPMSVKTVQEDFVEFFTDGYFVLTMLEALKHHRGPLYQYLITYRGAASLVDAIGDLNLGTSHVDEVLLLFNWTQNFPKTSPKDIIPSKNLIKMWTNFAKYSNPSIENIEWPELCSSRGKYLQFNEYPSIGSNLKQEIFSWWSNLPVYRNNYRVRIEF